MDEKCLLEKVKEVSQPEDQRWLIEMKGNTENNDCVDVKHVIAIRLAYKQIDFIKWYHRSQLCLQSKSA